MEETNGMNIYQRMSRITNELGAVAKNLTVGYGRNSYKAVGEADVLNAVKPAEEKWGIYSYPASRRTISVDTLSTSGTKTDNYGNESIVERVQFIFRIETTYRFVNIDNPAEYIDIISFGDGVDSADKAPGKAMTYSDKYALLKAYKIQTGDDPDQDPSPNFTGATPTGRETTPQHKQPTPPAQQPTANTPPETPAVKTVSPEQIALMQTIFSPERLEKMCHLLGIQSVNECPADRADIFIKAELKAKKEG